VSGSGSTTTRHGFLRLPPGWTREGPTGFGPFVTREVLHAADGTEVVWESRRHRKRPAHPAGSTWWAPTAIGWWIGVLFAIGSIGFALGSFPLYADAVGTGHDNLTYFIGSLFFTTAAFLQYCQVVGTAHGLGPEDRSWVRRMVTVEPGRIDWWASAVQFVGTLFFNVTTWHALAGTYSSATAANHAVWRPDAIGSICFLVASWLAWAEVCHGRWAWRPGLYSWWIAGLNMVGSVAFGVSAVASKVEASGTLRSLALTNLGTFVGAVCFLVGGILLLPERTEGPDGPDMAGAAA